LVKELGFEEVSQQFIDEYNSTAILYRHKKTGAEVMSVLNDDENKVFGVVFRTPPYVSTPECLDISYRSDQSLEGRTSLYLHIGLTSYLLQNTVKVSLLCL
jgi:hypothetical protein